MKGSFPLMNAGASNVLRNTVILQSYSILVQPAVYSFIDYVPFSNVNIGGYNLVSYNTPTGCNTYCYLNPACVAFVIFSNTCYLKFLSSDYYYYVGAYTTSFFPTQPQRLYTIRNGLEFQGTDIFYYLGSLSSCCQACDALIGCVGYVNILIVVNNTRLKMF